MPFERQFRPFTVPALVLSPAQAVDFLACLARPLPRACDASVAYWHELARFVLEQLRGRQFFPDLVETRASAGTAGGAAPPGGKNGVLLVATWRLLLSAQSVARLEAFAAAMPPVCRAAVGDAAPEPARLVESFLASTADALIRRDVAADPFFQAIHERAAQPGALAETRWVSALLAESGPAALRADAPGNTLLAEQVRSWTAHLDETRTTSAVRLCFTLEEPEVREVAGGGNGNGEAAGEQLAAADAATDFTWRVTFALDPLADDEPTIEAEDLFAPGTEALGVLGRKVLHRRAEFLSQLSAALEAFPPLERVVSTPAPTQVELSTAEAHAFLRLWARQLRERGCAVRVPGWASQRDRELGFEMVLHGPDFPEFDEEDDSAFSSKQRRRGGGGVQATHSRFALDSLLDFDWQVAVGDLRLSAEEFKALASRHAPLVRFRGQWLQIDPEAAGKALDFLGKKPGGRTTLAQALRTAFASTRADTGLPVLGLAGQGSWLKDFLEQAPTTRIESLKQPEGFAGSLRPYQLRGLDWLAFLNRLGIGACLADDMGLGKTIELIALFLHERRERGDESPGPTLLFAPTSVVGNWVRELERFARALKVLVHHGPDRLRGEEFVNAAARHDVVVTSYALAHRDLADLTRVKWHRVALDEAQKIKNPSAAATLAIRSIEAPHRVALTGTPIENHLSELWSIMDLLNPGLLGPAAEFRERFAVPIEKLGDADRAQRLRQLIRPFVLRRTKSDPTVAVDLPPKLEMRVFCNLTPEQAANYRNITETMLQQIDAATGIRRRGLILAALTRLKQVCDHPALLAKDAPRTAAALDGRSGKCERLAEMLEEVLEEGDAALVFTQFREMGHLLETILKQRLQTPVLFLHGGTPAKQRDELIQRFNTAGNDARVFLLSLRAGGLGLNLTAANHVFHFDRWWNPAVEQQATDRAHRIGQTRTVQVHKFVCIGTMEERIDKMLTDKLALADKIVGTGDDWLTELSTSQLREYLTLSNEAVGEF